MVITQILCVRKLPGRAVALLALYMAVLPLGCSRQERGGAGNQPEATLEELTAALDTWMMVKGTLPQSVNELTNSPMLRMKRLPTAPPGKKLAINPGTRQAIFTNE